MKIALLLALALGLSACTKKPLLKPDSNGLYHELVPRLSNSDRKVEIFWMKPKSSRPWPTVIFLHGNQEAEDVGGKTIYDWGALQKARSLGYLAVAVSLPGYGESSGPRDFAGPDSQQAVHDVIRFLQRRQDVADKKIALVGVSRGASVAAKVGEQIADVAAVVLVSGFYDLGTTYQKWKVSGDTPEALALAAELEHESVMSDAGPHEVMVHERSVLPVPQIRCPTLVLQGAKDPLTLPLQAEELVRKLKARKVEARAVIYPEAGHRIPAEAREREMEPFLKNALGN